MLFNFRNIRKMDIRKYINLNCTIKNVNYLDNKIVKDWIIFITFSNDAIPLSMLLLYSKFLIFSFTLPPSPLKLSEIKEMLIIPNYYNPLKKWF